MTGFHGSFLRFTDGAGQHQEVTLTPERQRITIGRSPQADLTLAWDAEVSRLHASVEYLGAHWTIVDDGLSRNGTFVNGERLVGRRRLVAGDRIRMGTSMLSFHDFGGAVDDQTRTSAMSLPPLRSLTETQRSVLIALCRPYKNNAGFASPASNQQIATELFLSVDAIKTHMRTLFSKFGVEDLPQNQKRVRLAGLALQSGIISDRDL
ncbi:FHA domain-containing protein [Nocardia terpenica]|uniref:FHA domain-containing protein n=1 Tax=Nocardia terpenica TaxID=455432 RepID=A0A164HQA8_9NOCA|nr:FHA domain-containing protein [Nocardia terpenica]KZM68710.1 LuxR family transcriptional regulator [Nocardia terpenica]MBF6062436.1 FHA domain-containing protein [Nocardia terpenica]MBF6104524.1 FHA domain-containing protein [Nocardia terpenica]MBF6109621.1 FHA domain-containing protein [Nocardia terpenica]MBF6119926.1 FHA domain-containing protein [Nocardia terpenica]